MSASGAGRSIMICGEAEGIVRSIMICGEAEDVMRSSIICVETEALMNVFSAILFTCIMEKNMYNRIIRVKWIE